MTKQAGVCNVIQYPTSRDHIVKHLLSHIMVLLIYLSKLMSFSLMSSFFLSSFTRHKCPTRRLLSSTLKANIQSLQCPQSWLVWRRNGLTSFCKAVGTNSGQASTFWGVSDNFQYSFSYCSWWLTDVWVCLCRDFTQSIGLKTHTFMPREGSCSTFDCMQYLQNLIISKCYAHMTSLSMGSTTISGLPLFHSKLWIQDELALAQMNKDDDDDDNWKLSAISSVMWNPLWVLTEMDLWCRRVDVKIIVIQNVTRAH